MSRSDLPRASTAAVRPGAGRTPRFTTRLGQENAIAAVLLVVFGGIIWLSQDFGPRARMIPLPLAIFGVVLTLIQILWQNLRPADDLKMDLIAVGERSAGADEARARGAAPPDRAPGWRRELQAYAVVAILIGLIYMVGILPAVFVFTAGYFLLTRHYSLWAGLVYTSIFTGTVYLLFIVALQIQPYHGLLAPLVERFR
jgi:hypothetical protein